MTPPRPDCDHSTRFVSIGGEEACETCAEIAAGWKECKQFRCANLVPPDDRRCETHRPEGWAVCPDCDGDGDTECGEIDCHGEFCEEGYVYCETCGGEGDIPAKEEAA